MEPSSLAPVGATATATATAPPPEAFSEGEGIGEGDLKHDIVPAPPMPGLSALGVHEAYVRSLVRRTPDWPRKGVAFLDMNPLLADSRALKQCIDSLAERYGGGYLTHVAGIDARGFTIGCACKLLFSSSLRLSRNSVFS